MPRIDFAHMRVEPAQFKPSASYCYGVGAFLLAGSELHRMAAAEKPHPQENAMGRQ